MYALMDCRSDVSSVTELLFGTLEDIAAQVLENCRLCLQGFEDDESAFDTDDECDEDEDGDLEDYHRLLAADPVAEEMLNGYWFQVSDMTTYVPLVSESYQELADFFNTEYRNDKSILSGWEMVPDAPAVDAQALRDELIDLCEHGFDTHMKYTYFRYSEDLG